MRQALSLDAESPPAWVALAMVLRERDKTGAANEALQEALRIEPGHAQALQILGDTFRYADRITEAEQSYRRALKARPGDTRLLVALALVLGDQVRYGEAFACIDEALEREPGSGILLAAKAVLLDATGKWSEAVEAFAAAAAADPDDIDIGFSRAISRLRHGDFAEGWKGFELRRKGENFVGRFRRFPFPEWQGEPLEGKTILVYPEQGLGDEIMFASCLPELSARARHVALECNPKLGALFARSFARCTVTPRPRTMANDWVNQLSPRPDYQVPIGSLPLHFRRTPEAFPEHRGYLVPDAAKIAAWKARLESLGPGRKIGLSWRGGVGHTGKARRSLTLEQLRPILEDAGRHFVNLQYTDVQAELGRAGEASPYQRAPLAGGDRRLRRDGRARMCARPRSYRVHLARAPYRRTWPARRRHGAVRVRLALRRRRRAHALVSVGATGAPARNRGLVERARVGREPDRADRMTPAAEYAFITTARFVGDSAAASSPSVLAAARTLAPTFALGELGYIVPAFSLFGGPAIEAHLRAAKAVVFADLGAAPGAPYRALLADFRGRVFYDLAEVPAPGTSSEHLCRENKVLLTAASDHVAQETSTLIGRPIPTVPEPFQGRRDVPWAPQARRRSRLAQWLARRAGIDTESWRLRLFWAADENEIASLNDARRALLGLAESVPITLHCMAPAGGAMADEELHPTFEAWSPSGMAQALASCDLVLLPDAGPASRSRMIRALHAGRFCIACRSPHHADLAAYAWVGEDLAEGIRWSLSHPAEVHARLAAGQRYLDEVHAPPAVARRWIDLFSRG